MADGYELDYKKVHNTLGEPNKCKYGEDIGQYVTNLWPEGEVMGLIPTSFHLEGILIEDTTEYVCRNSFLYGSTYYPNQIMWPVLTGGYEAEIYLIDLKQKIQGTYKVYTAGSDVSISIPKTTLGDGYGNLHFKVIGLKNSRNLWVYYSSSGFFNYYVTSHGSISSSVYRTAPIPLTENLLYNLTNENKEYISYYIYGYDQNRDEYVWIDNDTNYNGSWNEQNIVFRCPDIGLIQNHTQTINGFYPRIDQWYIVFYNSVALETPFSYKHFFFSSSEPLIISQTGQVIKNTYSDGVIKTFWQYTTNKYSDSEALRVLKTYPPIVSFDQDGAPETLSIDARLRADTDFINWLIYKNYNLVLVTVRDHDGEYARTTHKYKHDNQTFTIENKRYGILRYLQGSNSKVKIPTYEWTPETLDTTITFDSLDDTITDVKSHTFIIRDSNDENNKVYSCTVKQIPNQCQLCKWDDVDDEGEERITYICFALAVIKKNARHQANTAISEEDPHPYFINNGSHVTINDIPTNSSYYEYNRCKLKSLL